ncbi:hypothetical protein BAUCODRAFT_65656 [Baudoinia panamericana UAMH 10762]|uniref:WAC domain-containing protein n=1 Tax=Baudoinia panamericana (strain UAMH 10762) TaxID=717646 RepID=M2NII2_BAUPA|nr:uncharacterized protein BAUCODRAFT_65656 [Baudoinia panamericana UAMH 10762]EMC98900.1 hypothetical protein BAUCODRAFT_65656 [Baudoinia panamericana UAMH 10762]
MVLYKRKEFTRLAPPANITDSTDVFVMRGTNEVFTEYEKYLRRHRKFTDAVNGKSGLNYWDALESETKSKADIEDVFPLPLKEPILRKVQFSTISRIDDLVSYIFDEFKKDYFPGEAVIALLPPDGEQIPGMIREKAKFPMIRGPDGTVQRPAFSRYFVRLGDVSDKEALLDETHVRRDRKVFTKQNLRAFLKNSLQREAWIGAPWLVKEHLAIRHRLPMEIPGHLLQDAKLLLNKHQLLQMRPPKGRRSAKSEEIARQQQELARIQQQHPGATQQQLQQYQHQALASRVDPKPPMPPPIRYPIEDLDLPPKHNGSSRPQLKFFTEEQHEYVMSGRRISFEDISMDAMGLLLEVWNTLNVQCEVYVIDSFTFDDFVDAMRYTEIDPPCQLLEEVHCAVLTQLVDKSGKLLVAKGMLDMVADVEEPASDGLIESEVSTPQPDVPARSTRSRLSHVDPAFDNPRTPTGEKQHRAAEMLGERSWKARLASRDFLNGGWQVVLVGLLHQLSLNAAFKQRCDTILAELAPMDLPPSQETALHQYAKLSVDLRISALQMITILSITTAAIKEFLEACSEDMTDVRKRKIEHQREKKACTEEFQIKDREYKIMLPQNMAESPKLDSVEPASVDGEGDDTLETNGAGSSDPDEEVPPNGRSLRRASDRKRKRDEETARREKERADKAEAAKNKQSKEFKKVCREREELRARIEEAEAKIEECDSDLREANVQRTKMLGKDRFCNRYYWFERNGMPFAGLPRSSTADYGYANGRLWVQGPEEMEADGFINLAPEEQKAYRARFGISTLERRKQEEGATSLRDAHEWAYIDDPDRLDNLIGWLDDRGEREKKLRRELSDWHETIARYMEALKSFREAEATKKVEAEEEQATRVSTRHRAHEGETAAQDRCLKWTNSMALEEMGHLHSRPEKKPSIKVRARQAKGVAAVVSRSTGKPVTRQGTKYDFK